MGHGNDDMFCEMVDVRKFMNFYDQLGSLSEVLAMAKQTSCVYSFAVVIATVPRRRICRFIDFIAFTFER